MLYIVLVLVLAALGLLVTALITASSLWAWVSIGLSVLAGLILIIDWLRRRRRSAASAAEPEAVPAPAEPEPSLFAETKAPEDEEQTVLLPAAGELGDPAEPDAVPAAEPEASEEVTTVAPVVAEAPAETAVIEPVAESNDAEPGEEQTSPEDLAIVSDLDDEVVVVDEYPRYHLRTCGWLTRRDTIPIGVGEARQLGFTPCARCGPDTALAAAHRRKSKADN